MNGKGGREQDHQETGVYVFGYGTYCNNTYCIRYNYVF
jgi:hypothetical protein